jgi:hypothetical protein
MWRAKSSSLFTLANKVCKYVFILLNILFLTGLKLLLRGGSRYGAAVPAVLERNATAAWGTVTLPARLPSLENGVSSGGNGAAAAVASNASWRCLSPAEYCNCAGKRQHGLRDNNQDCVWVSESTHNIHA